MFSYDVIQKYNETEMMIYKHIMTQMDKIPYMTIRELAKELHVSPSTLLRFCIKNGCDGYAQFKEAVRAEGFRLKAKPPLEDLKELSLFFQRVNSEAFEEKLARAVEIVRKSERIIFIGIGSSGALARYGARYFSNIGKFSIGLEDSFYPVTAWFGKDTAIVALSESGESGELIELIKQFQQKECRILSITNASSATLAAMSDWNFSYDIPQQRINGNFNATTQIPVLFVIEAIARRI